MLTDPRDVSAAGLPGAVEGSLVEMFEHWSRWPRAELRDGGDHLRLLTGLPTSMFNGVFRVRMATSEPRDIEGRITSALQPFRARNLAAFWMIGPSTEPSDLAAYLLASGLRHLDDAAGMAADLTTAGADPQSPPKLTIRLVHDKRTLADFNAAMNRGFGASPAIREGFLELFTSLGVGRGLPLLHYVGYLRGAAVSSATLFRGSDVAGIYNVATVTEARGQGIGTAMTLAAMRDARALGYRAAVLHATPEGMGIYRRLGFHEVCTIRWYEWRP